MKILANKKKLIIWSVALIVIAAILILWFAPKVNAEEDTARRREYVVTRGDITVGTDADGSITSQKQSQFFDVEVTIEEYTVQKGDLVKSGEVIAKINKTDLDKRLKDANNALKSEEYALAKAREDKTNFIAQADKKNNDVRLSGETAYNEKKSGKTAQKTMLETSIAEKRAAIEKLDSDIAGYNAELEKAATPPTETPPSGTPPTDTPPATDYAALKANAEKEKEKLKIELAALEQSLVGITSEIGAVEENRKKEIDAENKDISLLGGQNDAAIKGMDRATLLAKEAYTKAKEKRDALAQLAKNPEITAQYDGVVLGLGYTPNTVIVQTTAIIDIGLGAKKSIQLFVDADAIVDIVIGQETSFYVDAYPDETFKGTVKSKMYLPNDTGKYGVSVEFTENEYELLDGMGASAVIISKQKKDVLTLQNKAITNKDGKQIVLIAKEDGTLEEREIKTGFSDGRVTEVLQGLNENDVVIVEEKL